MRRIADTNILVRYLTGDDQEAAIKATAIIKNGVEVLPETIPEALYVLTSKTLYAIPRLAATEAMLTLLDDITIEKKETIRQALKIYGETKLDYVDCLYLAVARLTGEKVLTLDKKLARQLQKLNEEA